MANVTFLRWRAQVILSRFQSLRGSSRSVSTNENDIGNEDIDIEQFWAEEEEKKHLEQIQNVSGLPSQYYQQLHGGVVEPPFKNLQRRRKMYMTYGSKSGEDPRLLWPSKQEVARMQLEETEDEVPLMEKIQLMNQERDNELRAKAERQKMVEKNMAQMNKWISEYHKKVDEAELEIQKRKDKKEALLDEAREYFGYRIKSNDPKFQQMVEEKEERERKEAKEQKKKEKARKFAERLKQDVLAMKKTTPTDKPEEEKPSQ